MHGYWMGEKTTCTFPKKRGHNIISLRVHWRISYSEEKAFGYSSSQAQQRVKYFKFYSEAKLFLKFSWLPASLVIRRFDVCFKNLAQTDKLRARNPNKQSEKPRNHPWQVKFIPSLWPKHVRWSPSVHCWATVVLTEENKLLCVPWYVFYSLTLKGVWFTVSVLVVFMGAQTIWVSVCTKLWSIMLVRLWVKCVGLSLHVVTAHISLCSCWNVWSYNH